MAAGRVKLREEDISNLIKPFFAHIARRSGKLEELQQRIECSQARHRNIFSFLGGNGAHIRQ
jgi:hypothetical protein